MSEATCDLTVDQVKTIEKKEGVVTFTAFLSGKMNGIAEIKATVKTDGRDMLEECGIDEAGNKVTIKISNTNTRLDSFVSVDEDVEM